MNIYCDKDGNLMVQHEDKYTCLKCETRIRVEFLPNNYDLKRADELIANQIDMGYPDGEKEYNDV